MARQRYAAVRSNGFALATILVIGLVIGGVGQRESLAQTQPAAPTSPAPPAPPVAQQVAPAPPFTPPPSGGDRQRRQDRERFRGGPFGRGFGGVGGFADAFQQDFSTRDLRLFTDELQLDDMQQVIVETLLEDYTLAYDQGVAELREKFTQARQATEAADQERQTPEDAARAARRAQMFQRMTEIRQQVEMLRQQGGNHADPEEVRRMFQERFQALRTEYADVMGEGGPGGPGGGPGGGMPEMRNIQQMMAAMSDHMQRWTTRKQQLAQQFLVDVQAQLDDDQQAQWPAFDRQLRREKTLPRGTLSGESLNLFTLLTEISPDRAVRERMNETFGDEDFAEELMADLNLDEALQQGLQPILDEYDLALDQALRARNDHLRTSQDDLFKAIQKLDSEDGIRILERQTQLRVTVRDTNLRYADLLAAAMPDELAATFRKAANERGFSRVFRRTQTQRMFRAARELENMTPEALAAIDVLEQSYLTELGAANERLVLLTRQHEPEQQLERARQMASRLLGTPRTETEDPIRKANEQRNQLGQRYQDQLKAMLTPSQWEALTADDRDRDRQRGESPAQRGPQALR